MASEVFVDTDRLEGSITSEGCVKIAQQTVVIGDVTASSGVIAGAVKGELDVAGPLVIDSTCCIRSVSASLPSVFSCGAGSSVEVSASSNRLSWRDRL